MNWQEKLKEKFRQKGRFIRVLAIAIGINLVLVGVYAYLSYVVKDITVTLNGKTACCRTTAKSVGELLQEWGVTLGEEDVLAPGALADLKDGMNINIDTMEVFRKEQVETTEFRTKKEYTSELDEGKTETVTEGIKGIDRVTYEVRTLGGEEISRREVDRETVNEPVAEKIRVGTAVAYDGEKYSRRMSVVATGYTHTGNRTATGTWPKRGTMAVDRGTIPMGSCGYVPGYGEVHAEDTGGAIKGNRIDLFFDTRGEAVRWGRRTVTIYIK